MSSVSRKSLLSAKIDPPQPIDTVDIVEVTMPPHTHAPLHLHPCPTLGVVTSGVIIFQIEGQQPQNLLPGDAFYEPANVPVARFDNDGDIPAKFVVHYLLSKTQRETLKILAK